VCKMVFDLECKKGFVLELMMLLVYLLEFP